MNNIITIPAILCMCAALAGCGGGSGSDPVIKYNQTQTIPEGQQLSVILPSGNYRADITSSNNGIVASWVGGSSCATSAEVKAYSSSCNLLIQGQLLILNPSLLGLGGSEIVTVKVTAL